MVGELFGNYSTILLMFGFAVVATGEGRTHFMMQYYAYILMFVVFDVMAIFLYAWGSTILNLPRTATLPIMAFLAIMFGAMAFALYQSQRRDIW